MTPASPAPNQSYSYDANGQLTGLSTSTHDGHGAPVALGTLILRYDNVGRLTYRNDSATAVASYYRYDPAGQLIAANSTAASPAPNQSYRYGTPSHLADCCRRGVSLEMHPPNCAWGVVPRGRLDKPPPPL